MILLKGSVPFVFKLVTQQTIVTMSKLTLILLYLSEKCKAE